MERTRKGKRSGTDVYFSLAAQIIMHFSHLETDNFQQEGVRETSECCDLTIACKHRSTIDGDQGHEVFTWQKMNRR